MMGTEIFEFDAAWAEKWTKTGVPFLSAPTVDMYSRPLVAGEPAGPSMVSEVPGPVSQQLHSELSSIQAMDSVHFFADYDKYVIVNV